MNDELAKQLIDEIKGLRKDIQDGFGATREQLAGLIRNTQSEGEAPGQFASITEILDECVDYLDSMSQMSESTVGMLEKMISWQEQAIAAANAAAQREATEMIPNQP